MGRRESWVLIGANSKYYVMGMVDLTRMYLDLSFLLLFLLFPFHPLILVSVSMICIPHNTTYCIFFLVQTT